MKKYIFLLVFLFLPSSAFAGTLTFLQSTGDSTNNTTYTFSGQNLGTASADRVIIVKVSGSNTGGANTVSSVTVGGITATAVKELSFLSSAHYVGLFIASVPTGTTGNVVVTFGSGFARAGIALWAGTGLSSNTPTATNSASTADGANPAPSTTVNVSADGFVIAGSYTNNNGAPTWAWTGVTEKFETVVEGNSLQSGASDTFVSAVTPLTVTASITSSSSSGGLVVASWSFSGSGGSSEVVLGATTTASVGGVVLFWYFMEVGVVAFFMVLFFLVFYKIVKFGTDSIRNRIK